MKELFMLRPDVSFLNHGSFGACPQQVFRHYVDLMQEMEGEPVEFIARRFLEMHRQARVGIGAYMNADPDDLVSITNTTVGVNIVARSLPLSAGDEILTTDHEYGACERAWKFVCGKTGAQYRSVEIPVPVTTHEDVVERFVSQISPATKVIFISHITSPTALTFPVEEICRIARERGIITFIDGAHVPGQIPLDLTALDADFYTGNFHKWLCTPKGSAFLYARRDKQSLLDPLVTSWGWDVPLFPSGSTFIDHHEYRGTRDVCAALAVPEGIAFQQQRDWDRVREDCHRLVLRARPLIAEALNATPVAPDGTWFTQMSSFELPSDLDSELLQKMLFERYKVEIPTFRWNDRQLIRISVQGYNDWNDIERLLEGLHALRDEVRR